MHTIHQRTVCPHDCPDTCAIQLTVEDGRAIAIGGQTEHEFTDGFLCHKVSRYLERVYHPDRLLYPQKRIGAVGSGRFERISWDEALHTIAERIKALRRSPDGPQSILPYSYAGTMGRIQGESLDRRFFHCIGASLLDRTICATAGGAGYVATMGSRRGLAPERFDDARLIINWGSNTAETNTHLWARMHRARNRGARIVTVDPFRSRTAAGSDLHLAPRVGTDAALALGMMHVIFQEGLQDQDYIDRYCLGGDELRDRVLQEYSVERVAEITGLPIEVITDFAHQYASEKPAAIRINYGLQRHYGGGMAVRTIACLPAVIGAWREASGGILLTTSGEFPINTQALQRPDQIPPGTRTINMVQLAEALEGGLPGPPVRMLFVYNSNPVAVAPDADRIKRSLARDDLFVVVHEQFPTDTTDYADLVLPATMQPEHIDLHTAYGHHWVQINQPVLEPPGECRSNTDVYRGLARHLQLDSELFEVTDEHLAREALWEFSDRQPAALAGITVDSLTEQGPQRLRIDDAPPYREGNFATPSGKCEFFNERLAAEGLDPLPRYTPPLESRESQPELAARYPLQLLTPPSRHFLNSSFVNIESLRRSAGGPELLMHEEDAEIRGLEAGQTVRIRNDRGQFEAQLIISSDVRPGLVVAPGIWWHRMTGQRGNANATTSTAVTDMGGGATFFDNLVQVESTA